MAKKKSTETVLRNYLIAIFCAVLVAFFIRFFFIEAYRMPSHAMSPAVEAGDTIFVSKLSYGIRVPGRNKKIFEKSPGYGDVVVFQFPDDPGREYIKRIVGIPGDSVQIQKGQLYLNGKLISKINTTDDFCGMETLPHHAPYEVCWEPPAIDQDEAMKLDQDEYFLVGDLRSNPAENRRLKPFGKTPASAIRGRAMLIWLSIQPPSATGTGGDWFSRIRFDRMLKRIE